MGTPKFTTIEIEHPPLGSGADDVRADVIGDTIEDAMDQIVTAALNKGWDESEVIAAVVYWAAIRARDQSSAKAVRGMLRAAEIVVRSDGR